MSASYALVADRGLALELEDDSGRIRRFSDPAVVANGPKAGWPWTSSARGAGPDTACCWRTTAIPAFCRSGSSRHARTIAQDTVLSAQVSRRWVDVLGRATFAVRHGVGELAGDSRAGRHRGPVGAARQGAGGPRRAGPRSRWCQAVPAVVRSAGRRQGDGSLSLSPSAGSRPRRQERARNHDTRDFIQGRIPGPTKVELSLAPEIVLKETDKAWVRSSDDARAEPAGEGAVISFEEGDPSSRKLPFTFKALALEPVPLPSFVVPRLLLKTVSGGDDSIRNSALYWVESHGPDFPFALPEGARWIGARVDGRLAEQVDYDPSRVSYRLRFPGEVGSRPVLVELEYQLSEQVTRSKWPAPRLLDGGVVLQALWEVRLPLEQGPAGRAEWMVR